MKDYSNSYISNLFSGYSSNASMYSDYSLIKSGSYKKLLKAYYAKNDTEATASASSSTSKTSNKKSVSTEYTKAKAEADSLTTAADKLNSKDFWTKSDSETIVSAVKDFVNDYNDTVSAASKVNSSEVSNNTQWMTSLSSTMSKTLSKIGIEVGLDNKLSLNEDTLKSSSKSTLESLFVGDYSYGGQIAQKAQSISSATVMSTSIYNSDASVNSALASILNLSV